MTGDWLNLVMRFPKNFSAEKIVMRIKTQSILKVKNRKMMRVKNKAAVKMKMKKTTGLLVLADQQDSTSQLMKT